jgi:pyruvate dehydrogenase E1 component alpha subunit
LIEAKSYRITPHSAATPNDGRPSAELDLWREQDPILRFSAYLLEREILSVDRVAELAADAMRDVDEAVEFALNSPFPAHGAELEDVYAPSTWTSLERLR